MRLVQTSRRRPSINITSLIDVLFLLLTFFLVTTTFIEQSALKVELPSMQHSERVRRERLFILNVTADGQMNYNGEGMDWEALQARLKGAAKDINAGGGLILVQLAHAPADFQVYPVGERRQAFVKLCVCRQNGFEFLERFVLHNC